MLGAIFMATDYATTPTDWRGKIIFGVGCGLLTVAIRLPIMVFFFLKDKEQILKWIADFLPHDHSLTRRVWAEVEKQAGNYVRGRVWEILIV